VTRGEIWWAELVGDAGFRPVEVVSRSDPQEHRLNVIIAEITRVIRSVPSEIPLDQSDGMPVECVINTDNLHTIPRSHLRLLATVLSGDRLFQLDNALRYSLGMQW